MEITTESFFHRITEALGRKLPFTAYSRPESNEIKGFFQNNDDLYFTKNYSESGFVFAPFDDTKPTILFPLSNSEICTTTFSGHSIENIVSNFTLISKSNIEKSTHVGLVKKG